MAESIKISELDELVSGSVLGTTKVPVVDGGATKYAQASSIKAFVNSDVATNAELASQIASVNSTIDGLTTADISENVSYKYYTDARVTTQLNALSVLSGSTTSLTISDNGDVNVSLVDKITFTNATVFDAGSGDVNVTIDIPSSLSVIDTVGPTVVNGVDQIIFDGATVTNNGNGDITVTIDGSSTDISALNTFTGSIRSEINGIEAFTASFSASVETRIITLEDASIILPDGTVSSSQQIADFGFITDAGGGITNGTVSGSQQIVELGFLPTSSLATETNYHIISQSIIIGEPINSNLLLSSVYVDSSRTITFSQFSQSVDTRIGSAGAGGSDYISNVSFVDNTITFTGNGFGFSGNVPLTNGIISASQQILDLGFPLTTEINQTYIVDRLPVGSVSSSAQITELGFLGLASTAVSSSGQIILTNSDTGGFDTSYVAENIDFQYYTDAKVNTVLNGLDLLSGSNRFDGLISASSQINYADVYNKVLFLTGSDNLTISSGSTASNIPFVRLTIDAPSATELTDLSNIVYGAGLISGSTQIANLGFIDNDGLFQLNNFTSSAGGFGILSSSISERVTNLSNLAITSSEQIDYNFVQNIPTFGNGDGILISQSFENQITISANAAAPTWDSVTFKPVDIVSSSAQVDGYHLFAKTGSENTFYGNQTITGSVLSNGSILSSDITTTTINTTNLTTTNLTSNGTSTFNGAVYNNVDGFTSVGAGTASLDFSTGNFFQIPLDDTTTTHISASNEIAGQVVTVLLQCGTNSTASFSINVKQPATSFYTSSQTGEFDVITFTTFDSGIYLTSAQKNFV
jgi:hypothetical protein